MAPSQKMIEVFELGVKLVVLRWPDRNDGMRTRPDDHVAQPQRHRIRQLLRVLDPLQLRIMLRSNVARRHHQRPKKVALPRFVHANAAIHSRPGRYLEKSASEPSQYSRRNR